MNQAESSYAAVLMTLPNVSAAVPEAEAAFQTCPQLEEALSNPTIPEAEKFAVIDRIFPESLRTFLKVVCRNGRISSILEIFSEYHVLQRQQQHCAYAVLEYVTPLTETQLLAMKQMICAKTGKEMVLLEEQQNPALVGGFVLHIGDDTYDRSIRTIARNLHKSLIRR